MKKIILFITTAVLMATSVFAQESNRDEKGKLVYGPYETNRFLDNWFVEGGVGVNFPFDRMNGGGLATDYGALALYANLGKWITPCYGVKVGWQGLATGTLNPIGSAGHFVWWPSNGHKTVNYVHGDFMVNASNLFMGYKERRIDVVAYLTAGGIFTKDTRSLGIGAGIQAPVKVSPTVKIVPSLQAIALNDHIFGGNGVTMMMTPSVSVQVALGHKGFTRVKKYNVGAATALYNEVSSKYITTQKALDSLNRQHNVLKDSLAILNEKNANTVENCSVIPPVVNETVYFEQGKSELSEKELAHLVNYAYNVVAKNSDVTFVVGGSVDSASGSAERNAELRKQRSEYVYRLMTKEFGLTNVELNDSEFSDISTPELSRAALILVK